ncbi:MAG: DMT family transporter [Ruminococcaceae bacterium]|nr:DMT family transporter [Oscillospiraceae bacterium]
MVTNKTQFKGVIMLLLTAFVWGSSFVAQSVGMESIEAFTFNGIRTLMGALVLLPVVLIKDGIKVNGMNHEGRAHHKALNKKTIIYGSVLGVFLCIASNFQQFAFNYSESGKIAFITALYMFFVPLLGLVFRKKVPVLTWICVAVGFVGLYFLCIDPNNLGTINLGDILTFICAIFFAVHILLVEKLAPDVDGVKLSCVQFFVSGSISCILMFIFESPNIGAISTAIVPLLYSGVMSCGFAYTFQIIGQKYTEATVASLLMCMESVFGVLCGALILHETLTGREIVGCVIMFVAIIVSQVADIITVKLKTVFRKG